jgi:uncharacterized integral membrane protein
VVAVLLLLPPLVLLVLFALSNPQPVELRLWPFDLAWRTSLALAVLVPAGGAFLLGAVIAWSSALPERWRAWRAAGRLRSELGESRAREAAAARLTGPSS